MVDSHLQTSFYKALSYIMHNLTVTCRNWNSKFNITLACRLILKGVEESSKFFDKPHYLFAASTLLASVC